jgi:hypothetical protein
VIDGEASCSIPAASPIVPKTKTGVEHRIPPSKQAVDLLEQIRAGRNTGIVFAGAKPGIRRSNRDL